MGRGALPHTPLIENYNFLIWMFLNENKKNEVELIEKFLIKEGFSEITKKRKKIKNTKNRKIKC